MFNLKALTLAVVVGVLSPVVSMNVLNVPQVLAQTPDERKAEADRLLRQGGQQLKSGEDQAALQSFQQAYTIYREISDSRGMVGASLGMGYAYAYLGKTEKATEIFEQLLKVAQENNDSKLEELAQEGLQLAQRQQSRSQNKNNPRKAEADQLLEQGKQKSRTSQFQEALQSFQQALDIYQEINDPEGKANALINMGIVSRNLEQYQKAIEFYQQSLNIYQEIGNSKGEANSLNNLGNVYHNLGQYQKAIEFHQQSLAIFQELGDRKREAGSLNNLGGVYSKLGQDQQATEFYQQSLAIFQELGDRQGEVLSLNNLGIAYNNLEQYQKAIELYQQSLTIARELGNRSGEVNSLSNLGNAYFRLAQYQEAIEFYQQSLEIRQEIGDRNGEASSLNNLGNVYGALGQYQKAIELYQQAVGIRQEVGDRNGEASSLSNLSTIYISLGQYQEAIAFLQKSLAIFQEIGDRQGEAYSLGNLGNAYHNLGQYQKAIKLHQQQLTIIQEISDRKGEANALQNLGLAYRNLRQYQKAIEYHQQSLTIKREIGDRSGEAASLNGLGVAYDSMGQYQQAIEYNQQSLAIFQEIGYRKGEAISLNNLGNAYSSLGQYEKAIEFYQQTLTIAREIGGHNREAISLNNLGFNLLLSDKPAEAEVELRKAIDAFESLRIDLEQDLDKVSIFDTYLRSFRSLQIALIAQNKTDAALEISEKGRARSLIELMSERLNDDQQGLVPTTEPLNIDQIRQIAKSLNTTLVQYSVMGYGEYDALLGLYIWVIQPTGEITFRFVGLSSLNTPLGEIVDNSRIDIGARGRNPATVGFEPSEEFLQEKLARQTANLRQLHELLIQPIADLLPTDNSEKVVFMPQGELYLVPFPALIDEQNQYLIEKHTILTSPSIQLLDIARKSHTEKHNNPASEVLIVGNPTMPEVWNPNSGEVEQLSSLQGAYNEAVAIAEKFEVEPLVQGQATEPIVTQKMQNARLIHLATHGLLEYGIPEESGVLDAPGAIALAPSGDADGLLTSVEIYNMKLNAELVVLSACDTGRGKIAGEGVIGLSRAFLQAGVPSLIVSLWKVPDDSTQFLMTKFYEYWTGDTDKVVALRRAILETKEKYPEPINWAAFTLIGEAQ